MATWHGTTMAEAAFEHGLGRTVPLWAFGFLYCVAAVDRGDEVVTVVVGSGTSSPSARRPSMCNAMALRIRFTVSARVAPVAAQPGRSGTKAEQFEPACSMTIA